MAADNTQRFSNRVEDYVKYRPGYPAAILDYLRAAFSLDAGAIVADIGSGTGISTEMFLKEGHTVFAVEPNREMREKATTLLEHYPLYHAVDGTAEETRLPDESIDLVVAGQAFHWFRPQETRAEFVRILRPGGVVVLIWNERLTASAFEIAYDELIIKHGKDYVQVDHRNINPEKIAEFYHPAGFQTQILPNKQVFDFEGLRGRLLSSSYMPSADDTGYEAMVADLRRLFDQYQENGHITIHYETKVYAGILK